MVSGGLTGALFMLVHPVLGRQMTPHDYAILVSLLGLFNFLALPAGVIQVVMARYLAELDSGDEVRVWVTVIKRALKRLGIWIAVVLLLWGLSTGLISHWLRIPSEGGVLLLGLLGVMSLFAPVLRGTLQGMQRFGWLAGSSLLEALARFVFAVAAVYTVGTVVSVMAALALSLLAGLLAAWWPLRSTLRETPALEGVDTGPIYRYLWPVTAGSLALYLLTNIDLMLYPRLLEDESMAAYGKAAQLSRIVFLAAQPIIMVMFPRAVTSAAKGLLLGPLFFSSAVAVGLAGLVSLFPRFTMGLMYGVDAPLYLELTRSYVWAALPLSPLLTLVQYLWARHRAWTTVWLLPVALVYTVGFGMAGDDPFTLVRTLAVGSWSALGVLILIIVSFELPGRGKTS